MHLFFKDGAILAGKSRDERMNDVPGLRSEELARDTSLNPKLVDYELKRRRML